MNRLIINTANKELFIVLQIEDKVFFSTEQGVKHHNEIMLPKIDELLKEHQLAVKDINEFGVVVGPGSFTGIRVGVATIKAFRDALNKKAKGINNLDYLYNLAVKQNKKISTVAILGSKDSYFVATLVNGRLYKYNRNLTKKELKKLAGQSPIGMFEKDENLNCFVVKQSAETLVECVQLSNDENLLPVYYQLSQAENEKLKKGKLRIEQAKENCLEQIFELEQTNILTNAITREQFSKALKSKSYKMYVAKMNKEIVGFILLSLTDEVNVESIAVNKNYRNLGVATKLIKKSIQFAKQNCLKVVSLEVSYVNLTAFVLYQKLGFKIRRIRKKYYADGADCFEMIKEIKI